MPELEAERKGMLNLTNGTVSAPGTDKQLSLEEAVLRKDRIHRKGFFLLVWACLLCYLLSYLPGASAEQGTVEALHTRWEPEAIGPITFSDINYDYEDYGQTTEEPPTTTPPPPSTTSPPPTEPEPPSATTPNPTVPTPTWCPVVITGLAALVVLLCLCLCCCPSVPQSVANWCRRFVHRFCTCAGEGLPRTTAQKKNIVHSLYMQADRDVVCYKCKTPGHTAENCDQLNSNV